MKVHIITIGDEILIGQIIDSNSAWMAQQLNLIGANIEQITSISDTNEAIKNAMKIASETADIVLMTGGLGPTKDDITKKSMAEYFGAKMIFDEPTWERIEGLFQKWGRSTTPAHREQCFMPDNALILKNKMGTAPGMWFEFDNTVFVSMPGVPYEMKYLMEFEVLPKLKTTFKRKPIAHRTILTVGEGESRIAARVESIESNLPDYIKLAFLPNLGNVRLRLSGTHEDEAFLNQELDKYAAEIEILIAELIYGYDTDNLESAIGRMLKERNLTIATAESCTGGFVAHKLTSISGSSAYYMGSVIAYDNQVKINQLSVQESTLKAHGAVSEATVIEMVKGAVRLLGTDIAVATSGIAGPGGGTEEKPVGTIWIAVGNAERVQTKLIKAGKSRIKNIEYASVYALSEVRQFLLSK
jgi:nicotinamide-nucleotide amidase